MKNTAAGPPAPPPAETASLATQAAMFRVILENSVDLIIRYDATGSRTYVSPSSRELLGYEPRQMLGRPTQELIHPDDHPTVDPQFLALGPLCPSLHLTFRALRRDGSTVWIEGTYRYLDEDGGSIAVLRDITARKQAEELLTVAHAKLEAANLALEALAQSDGLTGLANRRRFDELLAEEFLRARRQELPLGLVLIDVDAFKAFNDRYGHLAGDECLRRVSRAVEGVLRRPGDHVARYGGEELVVLLPATDLAGSVVMAQRICEAVAELGIVHEGSRHGVVTVSAGAGSLAPFDRSTSAADLVESADLALYRAKSHGRNCACGSPAEIGRRAAPALVARS